MQMEGTENPPMEVHMEIDIDEQKQRACTITLLAGMAVRARTNDKKNTTHDTKKICNDRTPPRTLKPVDTMMIQEDTVMESEIDEELQSTAKKSELIQEREKPPEETHKTVH